MVLRSDGGWYEDPEEGDEDDEDDEDDDDVVGIELLIDRVCSP